ncbi:MAG: hypothetical protein Q7O04_04785 [Candidatus Omnitrophota bacterium]|nr:hypothetical protein [Candidatus Omnitrophota bacterium]
MKVKNVAILACVAVILLYYAAGNSFADSAKIKSVMKINRMNSYIILINYETRETWTDSLLFKIYCKFDGGDFVFTSASLSNVQQGWHKTEIGIADVMRKRYGSLREYKIELYCKGILIDTKSGY